LGGHRSPPGRAFSRPSDPQLLMAVFTSTYDADWLIDELDNVLPGIAMPDGAPALHAGDESMFVRGETATYQDSAYIIDIEGRDTGNPTGSGGHLLHLIAVNLHVVRGVENLKRSDARKRLKRAQAAIRKGILGAYTFRRLVDFEVTAEPNPTRLSEDYYQLTVQIRARSAVGARGRA